MADAVRTLHLEVPEDLLERLLEDALEGWFSERERVRECAELSRNMRLPGERQKRWRRAEERHRAVEQRMTADRAHIRKLQAAAERRCCDARVEQTLADHA